MESCAWIKTEVYSFLEYGGRIDRGRGKDEWRVRKGNSKGRVVTGGGGWDGVVVGYDIYEQYYLIGRNFVAPSNGRTECWADILKLWALTGGENFEKFRIISPKITLNFEYLSLLNGGRGRCQFTVVLYCRTIVPIQFHRRMNRSAFVISNLPSISMYHAALI